MGLAWKFFLPLTLLNIVAAGIWAWFAFPTGAVASAVVLIAGIWGLYRANNPAPAPQRTFELAD
jgi:hypothetical protein